MRGFLFSLASDSESLDVCASLSDDEMAVGYPNEADWYENISEDEKLAILENNSLFSFEDSEWIIRLPLEKKEAYFAKRFQHLKDELSELTLEKFATCDSFSYLIEDRWDDAVIINCYSSFMTFDEFVRSADPDTTYYVGCVIAMH